jgi:putative flippase GtrA
MAKSAGVGALSKITVSATTRPGAQLFRYFIVGGTAAAVDWSFYWFFVSICGLHYLAAASISFTAATLVNYGLCVKWVFPAGRFKKSLEFSLVFFVSLVGLLFNALFLYILLEFLLMHFMLAKILTTGLVFFWNYFARKKFIFR